MAAAKKGGLGKGIDSLIPNKVSATKTEAKNENVKNDKVIEGVLVNINKVEPNREQPRKNFDEDALLELSESIKQFGVLSFQPGSRRNLPDRKYPERKLKSD